MLLGCLDRCVGQKAQPGRSCVGQREGPLEVKGPQIASFHDIVFDAVKQTAHLTMHCRDRQAVLR